MGERLWVISWMKLTRRLAQPILAPGPAIKENWEGRDAKQGQIHMTNQPAHHIPYMYLYTDRPWRTAEFVQDTLDRLFVGEEVGQGDLGDDDNGELSAWYVLSAMGLYPLTNGNGVTAIGPLFER